MKFLEKLSLIIFSIIILVLALVSCLLVFNWLELKTVTTLIESVLNTDVGPKIVLGVSIVMILLAIKCIFFGGTKPKEENPDGILLENEDGRLLISVTTIESLVNGVVLGFESAKNVNTKVVLDKSNNSVKVDLILSVSSNAVIKELSGNIQTRIKEVVKNATDLDIKEVNIKIKNITPNTELAKEQ